MSSRRHGRPHRPLPAPAPPPPPGLQLAATHPLQPSLPVRNPWVAAAESDHATSSSASVPPPRPAPGGRRPRSRASSLASSSRPHSRGGGLGASGCCSPGAQLLCYYCLRAALLASLLGGAALAVAGVVLRRHGRDDLGVLLYIGALAALVSALLLAVQHRARRHATRRHLRPHRQGPVGLRAHEEAVPLQQLGAAVYVVPATAPMPAASWTQSHTFGRSEEIVDERFVGRNSLPAVGRAAPVLDPAASISGQPWWRFSRAHHLPPEAPPPN